MILHILKPGQAKQLNRVYVVCGESITPFQAYPDRNERNSDVRNFEFATGWGIVEIRTHALLVTYKRCV